MEPAIGDNPQMTQQTQEVDVVVTSKGRRIQPPARYRQIAVPQGPAKPDGDRKKDHVGREHETGHVRKGAREDRTGKNVTEHCDCVYLIIRVIILLFDLIITPILHACLEDSLIISVCAYASISVIGINRSG